MSKEQAVIIDPWALEALDDDQELRPPAPAAPTIASAKQSEVQTRVVGAATLATIEREKENRRAAEDAREVEQVRVREMARASEAARVQAAEEARVAEEKRHKEVIRLAELERLQNERSAEKSKAEEARRTAQSRKEERDRQRRKSAAMIIEPKREHLERQPPSVPWPEALPPVVVTTATRKPGPLVSAIFDVAPEARSPIVASPAEAAPPAVTLKPPPSANKVPVSRKSATTLGPAFQSDDSSKESPA